MTYREKRLTRVLKSRGMTALIAMLAVVGAIAAYIAGAVTAVPGSKGLGLDSPNHWLTGAASLNLAVLTYVVVAAMMVMVNRTFNLLRTLSLTFGAFFLLMVGALPMAMCQFYGGTLLVVLMLAAVSVMFTTFNNPSLTRRVFLAFFLLTAGALTQYGFVVYLPILLVGCGQMRIFRTRTFLAAAVGVVTPYWIAWGFGWITPATWHKPDFSSVFAAMSTAETVHFLVTEAVTIALLLTLTAINMIKIYSYNLRTRAMNGLIIVISAATALISGIDFTNMPFYYPLLCCCTAFQLGHFIRIRTERRSGYIMTLSVAVIYMALYIWRISI